ncbi:ABC-type transport system involved in cytochrome bd biosynthesis fused ATPase/permease subunit [Haloactinopolyspora alba]|uniref:ABC-type transport system involved in cytochrome bd biosynthesis fused ATPase/permease subunit n=1 Tax=Haloactinopolyspora alba TaxID=648780 RepID=A0A2P8E7L7_9ACTN|nr:ATP-binding cassette domain-containing protein [Haloactinopolyspora alba]PSL05466.1 ABC-type transport system involved in cytochrome bd biosynthesis fused ATPase/permease subunit [Haloactinopolyspora alba]
MIHRRLLELAGAVPGAIIALAACGTVISALHVGFAFTLAVVISALIRGEGDVVPAFLLLAILTVARGAAIWGRELLAARIGASVRIRLRARLLDRLAAVPAAERDSGATATTVIDGVEGLDPYYTRYLPQLLVVLVMPALIVALVWAQAPAAGVALAVTVAVAVCAPRVWDARLLRNGRARWERFTRLSSDYVEALQQIPLLRAFGAADRTAVRFVAQAHELRSSTMRQLRLSLVETGLSALAMHLGTVLAALAVLAAVTTGSADTTSAVVVLMLAGECFRPVQDLGTNWHAGYLGLTAVDGLDHLLSTPRVSAGNHDRPASHGTVEVTEVSYRYPGARTGVTDLSLRIDAGETVAVIGPSGSGKSTLARLLERDIDPDQGNIRVGGTDLRDYVPEARCRSIVVVPQDPVLFAWTVRDNLRLYRPDATGIDIERAARAVLVHDVVEALPDGYDTVLAENGEQLSGGQRQRLAIARALLSPAPVLVLDEVTSALDTDTERGVVDGLATHTSGRTVAIIAHRETACSHASRWIALREGRIAETGDGAPAGHVVTMPESL